LGDLRAEHRRRDRDQHADDAEQVAAARSLRVGKPAEAQDEQDRRAEIRNRQERCRHDGPYLRNICSMRCVTAKPPNMLIATSPMLITASPMIHAVGRPPGSVSNGATWTSAPMVMMLLIALVTLI